MSDTRSRLLTAALRCIGLKGLGRTTSRDIATEAGVNLAAITYHFGSKEHLMTEALLDAVRSWLTPTIEVLGSDHDPSGRTLLALGALIDSFEHDAQRAPAFLQAMVGAPDMEPLQTGVRAVLGDLRRLFEAHLSELQRAGRLALWVEPDVMSSVLVAMVSGLVLQSAIDPGGPSMEAMVSQFGSLLLLAEHEHPA